MAFGRSFQAAFALFFIAVALSGGRAMADDCNNANVDVSACFVYYTPDNVTAFLKGCCDDLDTIVKTYTSCVCDAIDTMSSSDKSNIATAFNTCNITACNIGKKNYIIFLLFRLLINEIYFDPFKICFYDFFDQ